MSSTSPATLSVVSTSSSTEFAVALVTTSDISPAGAETACGSQPRSVTVIATSVAAALPPFAAAGAAAPGDGAAAAPWPAAVGGVGVQPAANSTSDAMSAVAAV